MKRRNAECGKMRRPIKRNKITEGIYGSTLLYLKFLLLWAVVILADFILEFRFEFLWPFWMLLRSVYDSFKYQGLAFSVFFVCIALTSDIICFFFIPVQWVFFAASTYVWVQYVWYTDKGVCLPTMILCMVFVYMEAGVRLRDLRHVPAHLDLCRPFAAHCIGYPVVTLGFGLKSYVGYRMRQRRQKEVARENGFYAQLLRQALPPHLQSPQHQPAIKESDKSSNALTIEKVPEVPEKQMNGSAVHLNNSKHGKKAEARAERAAQPVKEPAPDVPETKSQNHNHTNHTSHGNNSSASNTHHKEKDRDRETKSSWSGGSYSQQQSVSGKHAHSNGVGSHGTEKAEVQLKAAADVEKSPPPDKEEPGGKSQPAVEPVHPEPDLTSDKTAKGSSKSNSKWEKKENTVNVQREERRKNKNKDKESNKEKDSSDSHQKHNEQKEKDKEKEKEKEREKEREKEADGGGGGGGWGRSSGERERERALRTAQAAERQARAELAHLRHQHEQLQAKLNTATAGRQVDRAALASAERRLTEERRARQAADARHHRLQKSGECVWEWCRQRRTALEQESTALRSELQQSQDHSQTLTQSLLAAEQQVSGLEARSRENGPEAWRTALTALRERSQHLERSLSAETRIKLDLFSAVGEAKRQLGLREGVIRAQEKEIDELKGKIAQMLAVMPSDSFGPTGGVSKLRLMPLPPANAMSNLDPNATAYTPKGALIPCGPEA